MAHHTVVCQYCGSAFTAKRSDAKFCCPAHRMHASRLRRGKLHPNRLRRSTQADGIWSGKREVLDIEYLERDKSGTQLGLLDPAVVPVKSSD